MIECLLDIKDAARFLKVSEITIRRWTNTGKLKCYRLGGKKERRFYFEDLKELLHNSGSNRLKSLGFAGQKVSDGSHMTHFYKGKDEAYEISVPYLLEGIKRSETLLVVMPPDKIRELIYKMEEQRHPISNWIRSGCLNLFTGMDSPEEMGRYLAEFIAKANAFRVLGDMIWTVRKGWKLEALGAFERAPSLMPPFKNSLFLCQYSLEDFTGSTIMMAAEYHQQMIYKGRLEKSPYYNSRPRLCL